MDPDATIPWLTAAQQQVWRHWLDVTTRLPAALNRGLQEQAGLSLPDFDVLVRLTETPEGRVRVGDLASALGWERSRVSHHVTRMVRRGLVGREECADDGRGAWVVLTDAGDDAIRSAAPDHVATVRRLLLADVTQDELAVLDRVLGAVAARLNDPDDPDDTDAPGR